MESAYLISDEDYAEINRRSKVDQWDLLLTMIGTVGEVCIVEQTEPLFAIKNVGLLKCGSELRAKWLYYFLRSPQGQALIEQRKKGSTQQYISLTEIRNFPVSYPVDEEEMRAAVSLLSMLDDRITLLRETNATLEAIAQALFKSWFVDFDPVRAKMEGRTPEGMDEATAALFPDGFETSELGVVPRGWRVMPVGDAIEAVGGATPDTKNEAFWDPPTHCWTSPKDLSGIAAPVLLDTERKISGQGLAKIGSGLLPPGTLLMSSRAPIGYLALAQVPLAINQGYIAMLPGRLLPPLYMYFWCRQNMDNIKGRANGSTFMEISKKAFRPIPALVPTNGLVIAFTEAAEALFARLTANEQQAQTLSTLRDTLLPRLISGQLRLPEAQAATEAALGGPLQA
ncbi:restriction endonuclease subunit S [Acidovorax lacteus]|uniref:Type I restriction modification DNA specificity domain-containing protein n=1 Tax=Acidovorax lacteus TaxID=1924988 RepID=A0ABP8KWU1_9BURK